MRGEPARPPRAGRPSWGGRSDPGAARWIEDDGLLRDEGVVFGLSGVEELPEGKVESIRAYFRAWIVRSTADREALTEERGRLERRLEELRARIGALERRLPSTTGRHDRPSGASGDGSGREAMDAPADRPGDANVDGAERETVGARSSGAVPASPGLLRYGTGTLLALGVCALAYFVVRGLLGDVFAWPELVALGVMLAGMFVVFAPVSNLYSADGRQSEGPWATELWKVRLVEFGMPVVAAFFVVAWGESRGLLRDVGAFLFLGMLFLAGGRLLLSLLTRTGAEFRNLRRERRRRRRRKALRAELTALRDRAETLEQHVTATAEHLRDTPSPEELEALCEHKIALFRSEFELARAARGGRTTTDEVPIPAGEEDA